MIPGWPKKKARCYQPSCTGEALHSVTDYGTGWEPFGPGPKLVGEWGWCPVHRPRHRAEDAS